MMCPGRKPRDEEILIDYCAGVLDAVRTAEFELHLAECESCAALVRAQQDAWKTLDEWPAARISDDFDARLYARIAREQEKPAWRRAGNRWLAPIREAAGAMGIWKPVLGGALACAALALVFLAHVPRPADPVQPGPPARFSRADAVDMDQVQHALDDLELLTPSPANRI